MGGAVRVSVEDRCEQFAVGRVSDRDRFGVGAALASSSRLGRCRVRRMRTLARRVHDESHALIISSRSSTTTVQHHFPAQNQSTPSGCGLVWSGHVWPSVGTCGTVWSGPPAQQLSRCPSSQDATLPTPGGGEQFPVPVWRPVAWPGEPTARRCRRGPPHPCPRARRSARRPPRRRSPRPRPSSRTACPWPARSSGW